MVAAKDLFPIVGGGSPSKDDWAESLRSKDDVLLEVPVGTVENERCPFGAAEFPFIGRPDSGYGLLFLERVCFFELAFIWYVFRFVEEREFGSAVEEPPLKFASFFIHVEKGRRRPWRSGRSGIWVSCWEVDFCKAGGLQDEDDLTPNLSLTKALNV